MSKLGLTYGGERKISLSRFFDRLRLLAVAIHWEGSGNLLKVIFPL